MTDCNTEETPKVVFYQFKSSSGNEQFDQFMQKQTAIVASNITIDVQKPKADFYFVIDKSGSMGGSPIQNLKDTAKKFFRQENSFGNVYLISFNDNCQLIDITSKTVNEIESIINSINAHGTTVFAAPIGTMKNSMIKRLVDNQQGIVHVIFLTDGQDSNSPRAQVNEANLGTLRSFCKEYPNMNLCIHSVGFGTESDEEFLLNLSESGTTQGTLSFVKSADQIDASIKTLGDFCSCSKTFCLQQKDTKIFLNSSSTQNIAFKIVPLINNLDDWLLESKEIEIIQDDFDNLEHGIKFQILEQIVTKLISEANSNVMLGFLGQFVSDSFKNLSLIDKLSYSATITELINTITHVRQELAKGTDSKKVIELRALMDSRLLKNFNAEIEKRALGNQIKTHKDYNELVQFVDANQKSIEDFECKDDEPTCLLSLQNWKECVLEKSCLCIPIRVDRSSGSVCELTVVDPSFLKIHKIEYGQYIGFSSFLTAIQNVNSNTVHTDAAGRFGPVQDKNLVIKPLNADSYNACCPLFINPIHCQAAYLTMSPLLGWIYTCDLRGYTPAFMKAFHFQVLFKIMCDLIDHKAKHKDSSSIMQDYETNNNASIIQKTFNDVYKMCEFIQKKFYSDNNSGNLFIESVNNRTKDVVPSLPIFLAHNLVNKCVQPSDIEKWFHLMFEEHARRWIKTCPVYLCYSKVQTDIVADSGKKHGKFTNPIASPAAKRVFDLQKFLETFFCFNLNRKKQLLEFTKEIFEAYLQFGSSLPTINGFRVVDGRVETVVPQYYTLDDGVANDFYDFWAACLKHDWVKVFANLYSVSEYRPVPITMVAQLFQIICNGVENADWRNYSTNYCQIENEETAKGFLAKAHDKFLTEEIQKLYNSLVSENVARNRNTRVDKFFSTSYVESLSQYMPSTIGDSCHEYTKILAGFHTCHRGLMNTDAPIDAFLLRRCLALHRIGVNTTKNVDGTAKPLKLETWMPSKKNRNIILRALIFNYCTGEVRQKFFLKEFESKWLSFISSWPPESIFYLKTYLTDDQKEKYKDAGDQDIIDHFFALKDDKKPKVVKPMIRDEFVSKETDDDYNPFSDPKFVQKFKSQDLIALTNEWIQTQSTVSKLIVNDDAIVCQNNFQDLKRIAFFDMSIDKNNNRVSTAILVYEIYLDGNINKIRKVYQAVHGSYSTVPYVSSFLAFREFPKYKEVYDKIPAEFKPQAAIIDGNGILHTRECGLASHLGVIFNLPTVGISKTFMHLPQFPWKDLKEIKTFLKAKLNKKYDAVPILGTDGKQYGHFFRNSNTSSSPVFVSRGHLVTDNTALDLVKYIGQLSDNSGFDEKKNIGPLKDADHVSREFIKKIGLGQPQQDSDQRDSDNDQNASDYDYNQDSDSD